MQLVPLIRRLLKKAPLPVLISGILFFNAFLIFLAYRQPLPDATHPILFYSNQTRQDIKRTFFKALSQASKSIYICVYGISDPDVLHLLNKKAQDVLTMRVEYDPSASAALKHLLSPTIALITIKTRGLMHRKIVVLDHERVFLGSANFTTTSLKHHSNLVIGLHHPPLAAYLEHPFSNSFSFTVSGLEGMLYLLPDPSQNSIKMLLRTLNEAKKSIYIAMFTLTHEEIKDALIQARKRGVDVRVALDYYTARGSSKKIATQLQKAGIPTYLSQGKELLHHKWALIDDHTLIMGSANWTKAAFTKNQDFLLFLSKLNPSQRRFLRTLWNVIETESL